MPAPPPSVPAAPPEGAVSPEAPCAHCGLPVGRRPARTAAGEACCCTGCATVRDVLAASGLGETYDRLRTVAPSARPAGRPQAPEALALAELDRPEFLDGSTRPAEGGRAVDLFVDGVHCAACVWLVERLPYEVDGVSAARLDLPRARLSLTFDPESVRLGDVARWLARFGYAVRPSRPEAGEASAAERSLLVRMGVAWALAGNIMLVAFALYSGLGAERGGLATAARWFSLALMVPAVGYGAAPFFRRAWASARAAWRARSVRHLHLDTPIALGIAVGAGQSAWATVTGRGEVWFDSVAVLIAALLTARWLQLRSRRLAGEASDRLLALVPRVARRVGPGGAVAVVDLDDVRPGDTVEVPAGEVVPVDGVVAAGASRLDRAALTGEARPEPVDEGAPVEAGTTNLTAPLRVRATAVGEATRVGRLLAWVERGEVRRAPVVLWADRIGGFFVLTVLGLAALTAGLWLWLEPAQMPAHLAALLVVTCPCALGMATPLALAVASGRAARAGIFVKSDAAVQRLTEVDTVVLDKTGTLTEGRMELAEWEGSGAALDLAAALDAHATHPVAEAIVRARGVGPEPVTDIEAVAGQGVRGRVGGAAVAVGRPDWVEALSAPLPARWRRALAAWAEAGHTPVAVAVDGAPAAVLAVGDRLRAEAADLVAGLQAEGKAVHILSGDDARTVAAVAGRLGVESARGGVSPEAKREAVAALQDAGGVVLMVGDGVNDAAALRQADVGAAVGGGTTAALVAADLFLTRRGVAPLVDALGGAEQAMRTVRRLLALSLGYNAVGAAAAVAGLVTPLVAAAAMPISSLAVVGLALLQPSFAARPAPAGDRPAPPRPDGPSRLAAPPRPAALADASPRPS
ncbi:heavy metal translocating P-type ATPase metal-binding domain-containing protein [Rubrivirga sp. S365]|uniref:heavy metal translocating P-type ATPase n=1 Tax=Rubrivirga sp. S365 TaxID=3076080 RepID=UPI0028C72E0C|nr:heavy metal translocating P-type ATPase metal-binding domain-containing protein [Rubrivirga sp. S365]MDT7857390.1 heavy metal translocating P-type ATPase metal-binding domain-containing protein [Rubrivirga sp. S365]